MRACIGALRTPAFVIALVALVSSLAARPTLAAPPAWSEESWRVDLEQAASAARASHPKAIERLERLEGLDPDVYLARRRPEPEVARELVRLVKRDEVPAALLAELSLALDEGRARYPFSAPERFLKRPPDDVARLMALERAQLRAGLLIALGEARHPTAFYLARAALLDDRRALEQRRVAAMTLGKTRDARAVPLLARLALDEKASVELKTAALSGLAHIRSLQALEALEGVTQKTTDPALARAAALSLGNIASASSLRGRPLAEAEELRAKASKALVDLLARIDDERVTSAVVDALGMVAHPLAVDGLRTLAKDERSSDALRERVKRAERRLERALSRAAR